MSKNRQKDGAAQQRYRPRTGRVAVVLLLSFTFCVSALIASGTFDSSTDPSRSSTRILTPEEAVQQAEQGASDGRDESAPIALVALLLLASGALLISLAIPTPAERRRRAAAAAAVRINPDIEETRVIAPAPVTPCTTSGREPTPMPGLRRVGAVRPTRPPGNLRSEQVSECTCCPVHTRTVAQYAQVK